MHRCIVIIPYFGAFPEIFKYWERSVEQQPDVDFLLITDNDVRSHGNIRVLHTNFESFKQNIQQKFDFAISLDQPYKLCDYKPAYGYLFNEYISDYDFWGWCDIDLVFGRIRHFITEYILAKYDFVSGWGHFSLVRNTEFCNNLFMQRNEGYLYYKDVYSSPVNYVFDEYGHGGIGDVIMKKYANRLYETDDFDDVFIPRLHLNFHAVRHPERSKCLIFRYDSGILNRVYIRSGGVITEETLYAHFQKRLTLFQYSALDIDSYLIIPNKFVDYQEETFPFLRWYGRERPFEQSVRNSIGKVNRFVKRMLKL